MPPFHAAKESLVIPVNESMLGARELELVYLELLVQNEGEEPER